MGSSPYVPRWSIVGRWAASLIVGAFCLWLSLRGLDLESVRAALLQAKAAWLIAAVALVVAVALLKALRWWYLYPRIYRPASWGRTFSVLMTTQMLNVLIPVRVGELARIGLMLQDSVPVGTTLGTVVVEKSVDLVAIGFLVALAVPVAILPDWFPSSAALGMGISGAFLLAVLVVAWLYREWIGKTAHRILEALSWLPMPWRTRLVRVVSDTLEGLGGLTAYRTALPVLGLTMLTWMASVSTMMAMLEAFNASAGWQAGLVLSLAIYLSNLVPTPPALVGVVGAVALMVLGWFGVSRTDAMAVGIALNVVLVGPLMILGGWATWSRFAGLTGTATKERWAWSLGLKRGVSSD